MSINAYSRAETLKADLQKHTEGVTHTATFLGRTIKFPITSWPTASKIGIFAVDALKTVHLGNTSRLQDISKQITELKKSIQSEKEKIINDGTDSYQKFLKNVETINSIITNNTPLASKDIRYTTPLLPNMELQAEVKDIKEQRSRKLEEFTAKHLEKLDTACSKGINNAQNALGQAYSDVKKSALTPEEKTEVLKKLFEKYAEHAESLHRGKYTVSGTFVSLKSEYMNPQGLRFDPALDKSDIDAWRSAMSRPILSAATSYRTEINSILNKNTKLQNDIKILINAQNQLQDLNNFLLDEKPDSYKEIHKILNPKGVVPLARHITL